MKSPAEKAEALQAEYRNAQRIFAEIFDPLRAAFEHELEAAGRIIKGPGDRSPEAEQARARVRAAMYAATGSDPASEMGRARALLDEIEHALRKVTLAPTDHYPMET
jgi:hypothetical protein